MKQELLKKFKKDFQGKRLLAIQLNGFSHKAFYDDGTKNSNIQVFEYSGYMSDCERSKEDNTRDLFKGIGHLQYQNNPKEIIYVHPSER